MNKDIFVQLLGQRQFKAVRSILDVMNEVDIASLLSELDDKELALAFRLIPKDKAAEVFANMETSMQTYLVDMFSEKELKELLDDLYMDDTVDLLEELPANLVNRILDTVSPSDRTLINQLLNYPEDSAGSIMTTEYVDIRQSMTVAQSMAHIKETGIHKETIYTCYVTDKRKLIGIVSAKDLMTTDDGILISELMETEIISVRTYTDKEEVAQLFRKYDLLALPVLDKDGLMVGIVTFDDAMDVMVEEATEDITKMAAINPSEKTYFNTSTFAHAKNRIPWLLILMLNNWDKTLRQLTGGTFFLNNLFVLALVYASTALPFTIYLLSGYFRSLAKDFEEAAYVDGASYFTTMVKIIFPMAKPSIVTVILFSFLSFWNEYIISMTLLTKPELKTLPVGLMNLMAAQKSAVQYGQMYAGLVIVMLPTLILYICVQKKLTQGMTLGGLKG